MSEKRLFTDEELKAMGERTLDRLQTSIDEGDTEQAKRLSRRMYNEFLGMHDLYRDWLTDLLSFIGRRYGDEILHEALNETVSAYTSRLATYYEGKTTRQKLKILLSGFRGHLFPIKIEEDEEKLTVIPGPCASGGRQIQQGAYGPPTNFYKIEKPQTMTFNRPDFPVYCAHCFFQNIAPLGPDGNPLYITEPSEKPGQEPCRMYIYK